MKINKCCKNEKICFKIKVVFYLFRFVIFIEYVPLGSVSGARLYDINIYTTLWKGNHPPCRAAFLLISPAKTYTHFAMLSNLI